jgi:hypothetical protein
MISSLERYKTQQPSTETLKEHWKRLENAAPPHPTPGQSTQKCWPEPSLGRAVHSGWTMKGIVVPAVPYQPETPN